MEQLKEHAEKAKEKGDGTNVELKLCDEGGSSESGNTSGAPSSQSGGKPGASTSVPMS